jgi:hypothetical protein
VSNLQTALWCVTVIALAVGFACVIAMLIWVRKNIH